MSEARTYVLGGETRRRSLFGAGVTGRQIVLGSLGVVAWLILMTVTKSWVVLTTGVLVGLAVFTVTRRRDAVGDSWMGGLIERLVFGWQARQGATTWRPEGAPPPEVGEIRVISYVPPTAPDKPLAVVHHKHPAHGWAAGYLSATFEVHGTGDGLLTTREVNTAGQRFERLLGSLASAEIPVNQLDLATRVLPVDPQTYRAHLAALLDPAIPEQLRASMEQGAEWASRATEEYRTYATIRVPLPALVNRLDGQGDLEDLCGELFGVLGEVIRRVDGAGYRLRAVLGPRRLGALIRHLHNPDADIEDQDGIATVVDGWGRPRTAHRLGVELEGSRRTWWHAVASVPRDAWPWEPVGARLLEDLVTGVTPATIRTVQAQFRLVPKARAREIAKIAHTYDDADIKGALKRGKISTGEAEASASASKRVLSDLLTPVVAGVYPAVRVAVSAPDLKELRAAKLRLSTVAENSGLTRLRWHDRRHAQALPLVLPLARGIKA